MDLKNDSDREYTFLGIWLCDYFNLIVCFIGFAYFKAKNPEFDTVVAIYMCAILGNGSVDF